MAVVLKGTIVSIPRDKGLLVILRPVALVVKGCNPFILPSIADSNIDLPVSHLLFESTEERLPMNIDDVEQVTKLFS